MENLVETSELEAFVCTVDAGSLSKAAKELEIPRATLSRRLANLEERLGVRLLRRTTRRLALTDAGEVLLARARTAIDAVRDAVQSVQQTDGAIRGLVRFASLPIDSASLDAMISRFLSRHPHARIQVNVSAQFVDFVDSPYDVALRASAEPQLGLVRKTLLKMQTVAIASPSYLQRAGVPERAKDLSAHACILNFARGHEPNHEWPLLSGGRTRVDGVLVTNDLRLLCRAVIDGRGIGVVPLIVAQPFLNAGSVVRVLEDVVGGENQLAIVYPERELMPPVVRAFITELVTWGQSELAPSMMALLPPPT